MSETTRRRQMMQTLTVDTASILLDLRRHWWNLLLMLLAGALLGYVLCVTTVHQSYQSDVILAVLGNSGTSVSNVQTAGQLSGSLTNVISSQVFHDLVAAQVNTSEYHLSAHYIADTNLISITATAGSPQLAFQVLRATIQEYPVLLRDLMADLYMVTVQHPGIPTEPMSPLHPEYFAILGAGLFVLAYALVVVLLSVLRDTIKNVEDMRNKVDATMLGVIPYFKRGAIGSDNIVIALGKSDFRFEEQYQLIASRTMTYLEQNHATVLAVTSVLQNEGKSHCLINLAYSMAKSQKRVLVIDSDFRNPSLARIVQADSQYDDALSNALQSGTLENLYQFPGTSLYCLLNGEKSGALSHILSEGSYAQLLKQAKEQFDYVLVDTGPVALVADTTVITALCDASLLLVAQDVASIRAINDVADVLDRNGNLLGCIYRETRRLSKKSDRYGYGTSYGYSIKRTYRKEV